MQAGVYLISNNVNGKMLCWKQYSFQNKEEKSILAD